MSHDSKKLRESIEGEEEPTLLEPEEAEGPIAQIEYSRIVPDAVQCSSDEVYEFERILGEGAFSSVVLGVHKETDKKCAIKIIDKAQVCDTEQRRTRVLTEIGILRQCDHPHILKVHEIYETDIDISLVLDLMEGGELFDLIVQEIRFPEVHARRLARQMLSALDYLHDKGICHRDLKPENMLCTSKDITVANVCITDFGLAKFGKDCLATPCGSVSYVAPEIVANELYDNSVDIWAFGCVLYFMLFGKPPFYVEGDDEEEIMDLVEEGIYNFPSEVDVSETAKEFLSHLLEKDPGKRFKTKQALIHKWLQEGKEEGKVSAQSSSSSTTSTPVKEVRVAGAVSGDSPLPSSEKNGNSLNLSKERRENLKSSMNKVIDVQRDGVFLKPPTECSILKRRGGGGTPLALDFGEDF